MFIVPKSHNGYCVLWTTQPPGSALSGRKSSALKNSELKFWLQCRGDSCKGLKTKAPLVKRQVNKMAFNNTKIVIKYISFY